MLLSRPQKYHMPVRICSPIIQHKKSMSCSYAETTSLTFLVTICFSLNSLSLWNILCWQQRQHRQVPPRPQCLLLPWLTSPHFRFIHTMSTWILQPFRWMVSETSEGTRQRGPQECIWAEHTHSVRTEQFGHFLSPWTVPSPNVWASALCHMVSFAYVSMSTRWFLLIFIVWTTQMYVLKLVNHRVVPPPPPLLQWVSKLMWINVFMSFLA